VQTKHAMAAAELERARAELTDLRLERNVMLQASPGADVVHSCAVPAQRSRRRRVRVRVRRGARGRMALRAAWRGGDEPSARGGWVGIHGGPARACACVQYIDEEYNKTAELDAQLTRCRQVGPVPPPLCGALHSRMGVLGAHKGHSEHSQRVL
jgi:hypothetical protein